MVLLCCLELLYMVYCSMGCLVVCKIYSKYSSYLLMYEMLVFKKKNYLK